MIDPAPAVRLAWLRVVIGAYALVYTLVRLPAWFGVLRYRPTQFHPVGPITLLDQPWPAAVVVGLVFATVALGVAFCLGWRFRWTGPGFAAAFMILLSYRNSWGMIFHTENLMVFHVLVLGLGRSADAVSLDARVRRTGDEPEVHWRYGWPIRLMCAVTVLVYLLAGIAKLKHAGLAWVTSDALLNFVAYDNVRKLELGAGHAWLGGFLLTYDELFPPLAALSLGIELGAPLALLHPRIARVWVILIWSFHVGVLLVMYIFFHYPLLGFAFLPFFAIEEAVDRMRAWIAARRSASVRVA